MVFDLHTGESLRGAVARVHDGKRTLTPGAFKLRSQLLGFTYNPYTLVLHERLNLDIAKTLMYDWAHLMLCDGLGDNQIGMMFKCLQRASGLCTLYRFAEYATSFTLPQNYPAIHKVLTDDKCRNNLAKASFSTTASELLTVVPLLTRFITCVVLPSGDCPLEAASCLAVLELIDALHNIKAGCVSPERLQELVTSFLKANKAAYGNDMIVPKYHYILHLPDMLRRFKTLFSCLVNERRHRVVKKYTKDRVADPRWELGALEEIVTFQMYEAEHVEYGTYGLMNPHEPLGLKKVQLDALFPHASTIMQGIDLRNAYGTVHVNDVVWVSHGDAMFAAQIRMLCSVDGHDIAIVDKFDLVKNDSPWSVWRRVQDNVQLVSHLDVLSAVVWKENAAAISVHKPLYLRES